MKDELWQEVWSRIPGGTREAAQDILALGPRLNGQALRRLPDGTRIVLARWPSGPLFCTLRRLEGQVFAVNESDPRVQRPLTHRRDIYLLNERESA